MRCSTRMIRGRPASHDSMISCRGSLSPGMPIRVFRGSFRVSGGSFAASGSATNPPQLFR
nr:MAG TPA: hypothetical protein [Caudoviricetes sp.]